MRVQTNLYPQGKVRALTMSYDDGRDYDRRLIEIFNRYGIRGTFHLNSGKLGQDNRFVTADEIASLYAGHEVSVHTLTHPYLDLTSTEEVVYEVMEDRRNLEALVGYPVRGMSYPFGTYNEKVINQLRGLGIVYARTTKATNGFNVPDEFPDLASDLPPQWGYFDEAGEFPQASLAGARFTSGATALNLEITMTGRSSRISAPQLPVTSRRGTRPTLKSTTM